MKYTAFFKIGVLCLALLMLNCEKDEIKVSDAEYVSGGIGTSFNTGAITIDFNIPNNYAMSRVRIEFPEVNIIKEESGTGDRQVRLNHVSSGIYNYTFEFWGTENSYSTGGIEEAPLSKYFIINETVEVINGKTLILNIYWD
ncbi:hypothetical protein [Winogradskyella thalassocola]|uniref:Uncharacterized protein n=1 Tax=Winogradskyella thalassocola TaxID=262004 RepID=A0A1G7WIU8_9FLAO|nr:hypothetical protein [Winogradskyella thalassocola]SDG71885.1 hypothetical protein SAMN04489796_101383 [Winogradskyella thalassocola]